MTPRSKTEVWRGILQSIDMKILSIDFALKNCGYALVQDDTVLTSWVYKPPLVSYYTPEYLDFHRTELKRALAENPDLDAILIEGPSFCSNGQMVSIGALFGMFQLEIWDSGLPGIIMQPSRWKKLAVGSGKAKKPEIKAALIDYVPKHKGIQQDEYDAAGMARAFFEGIEILHGKKALKPLREIVTGEGGFLVPSQSNWHIDTLLAKL